MNNNYFDPKLRDICRGAMRDMLRLYFEFGFKIEDNMPVEIVAKINDMHMDIENPDTSDERLMTIYTGAIDLLSKSSLLRSFCLLPTLFLRQQNVDDRMREGDDAE